jgi:putative oxidoreductase
MKKNLITETTVFLLILLFSYASMSKLLEPDKFIFQMRLSPLSVMQWAAPLLRWIIPLSEAAIVISLFARKTRIVGFLSSLFLLSVFEIYITAMLISGLDLPCTCGGIISKLSWKNHLWFNGFFIVMIILSLIQQKRHRNVETAKNIPSNLSRA